jgi:hypothetical protein
VVSRCRSFDGAKAQASSATARSAASSRAVAARWACARKTASQKPPPWAITTVSHSRSVAASPMSPASTAHSMPPE